MHIEKYKDTIKACRFCFMCRHLSPIGNVTFKESDIPRGRALILDCLLKNRDNLKNNDYIQTIYNAELSAACRYHCVSHYDENGLLLAAREDIVEAGLAPENVKLLAKELQNVKFHIEGKGETLYYIDPYTQQYQPEIVQAFIDLTQNVKTIQGGDTGKALKVLGFTNEAKVVAEMFKSAIKASGCKTLAVSCPAAYDALKNDFPIDGISVLHTSEYLKKLNLKSVRSQSAYYLDSDYLKNYNKLNAPTELLTSLGYDLKMFGTNPEESYSAGEGSVVYDKLNPKLTQKLCDYIYSLVENIDHALLITASPYTRYVLTKFNPQIKIISLEQAVQYAMEDCVCHS